jgi:metallo-beta-lactamase family protein
MAERHEPTLRFLGAAGTVTGSRTLLDTGDERILIDCGMFQGRKNLRLLNWEPFPIEPESIDAVLLTHAHLDHCGYLPRLVRMGFRGPVFCTENTRRLAEIVLADSAKLHEEQASHANRHGYSKHDPALPLYTREDAERCNLLFQTIPFDTPIEVAEDITASFSSAGHILGAAWIAVEMSSPSIRTVLSGDLGRPTHPLLLPAADIGQADIVVVESTYGDEEHHETDHEEDLRTAVGSALERGGVAVIPAFAVDRTEVVLHHLDRLVADGRLPDVPVFLDSPMANRALDVYQAAATIGSPELRPEARRRQLFPALDLTTIRTVKESTALNREEGPMIIISASGMATGGRVIHHLVHRIGDERNSVVLVGFQAPGTRGDRLASGERSIKMLGGYHQVHAEVHQVALSTHADQSELVAWLTGATPLPRTVFVQHGEPDASRALAGVLHDGFGLNAVVPRRGELVRLDAMSWT